LYRSVAAAGWDRESTPEAVVRSLIDLTLPHNDLAFE